MWRYVTEDGFSVWWPQRQKNTPSQSEPSYRHCEHFLWSSLCLSPITDKVRIFCVLSSAFGIVNRSKDRTNELLSSNLPQYHVSRLLPSRPLPGDRVLQSPSVFPTLPMPSRGCRSLTLEPDSRSRSVSLFIIKHLQEQLPMQIEFDLCARESRRISHSGGNQQNIL